MSSTLPSFYIVDSMISVQADDELGYDNAIDDAIELPNGTEFPMLGESLKRSNETTGDVDEGHTKRAAAGQTYDLKTGITCQVRWTRTPNTNTIPCSFPKNGPVDRFPKNCPLDRFR